MKITKKKPVTACNDVINQALVIEEADIPVEVEIPVCKYQNAVDLISAAIESLAEIAKEDEIAKDSIANLGVVMLDLKGGCE